MQSLYQIRPGLQIDKAVYTTKTELLLFFRLLDRNPIIKKFLQYDSCFRLADKYLIAMVFIYFKRAQLTPEDYTYLNFFAGLCLAHSMEEDIELSSEIYPWALGSELKNQLPKLLELKILLWEAMDFRAAVSCHCCKQLISISKNHPIWLRERSPLFFKQLFLPKIETLTAFKENKETTVSLSEENRKKQHFLSKEKA